EPTDTPKTINRDANCQGMVSCSWIVSYETAKKTPLSDAQAAHYIAPAKSGNGEGRFRTGGT
nr:hypothetical protein [Pirellulaceae bacterium]